MRKHLLLTLLILAWGAMLSLQGQNRMQPDFCSPFDFPLLLSANFGELRPNHFHNGLDIKTGGVTGKPIYSVFTSVYGHVVSFAPKIQEYVRKYQYEHETFVCDIRIEPDVLPIEKGEMIALSGNEGSSAGPHLHLELRRNDNGDYVDPMPYFRKYLKDDRPEG